MTKSELIEQISAVYPNMTKKQIEFIVNNVFYAIKEALANGEHVEIRGFGTFKVRKKEAATARNPKTGKTVKLAARTIPGFKPSKDIKNSLVEKKINGGLK